MTDAYSAAPAWATDNSIPTASSVTPRILAAEGTGQNPRSSAAGPGQFIDKTWLGMINKYRPDLAYGKTPDQIVSMKTDPQYAGVAKAMTNAYAAENSETLSNAGLQVTPGNVYLAHFAGPQGATNVLKADPNTPVSQVLDKKAMDANPFLANMTTGQLQQWAASKVGDRPEGFYGGRMHVNISAQPTPQAAAQQPPASQTQDIPPPAWATDAVQNPSIWDRLTGNGVPRYQLWPERAVRGVVGSIEDAIKLPGQVVQDATTPKTQISDSDVTPLSAGRALNAAAVVSPVEKLAAPIPASAGSSYAEMPEGKQVAQAAQNIGVDLPRAVTSDSIGTQWAGKIATNIPFAGTPLRKASEQAIDQLGNAASRVQAGYGSGSIPSAGGAAREGITNYIKGVTADRKSALYDKVGDLVDPKVTKELSATSEIAQGILNRRSAAGITQPSEAVSRIYNAITTPGGLSYQGTKDLRTYIGEMLEGRSPLPADMSQGELKQIYGGLSQDLRSVAQAGGGDAALRAFERANNYAKLASQRNERLAQVIGANSDEGIFSRLTAMAGSTSRADISRLREARKAVDGTTWDEIASGVISNIGRDAEGNFSPDKFVTAYGKLTPDAKSVLFKSTGKADYAKALDDIAQVSSRIKSLNKYANPSGTGQSVAGFAELQGMVTAPLSTLGAVVSGRVLSSILAKPQSAKSIAAWSKAYEEAATKPSLASRASFQQASKLLAASIGRDVGRPDLAPALLTQLNGAVPGSAEPQQKQR